MVVLSFLVRGVVAQEVAPDFTLTDIDGVEFSLSDYRGRVVLLDFFATWCGYCVAQIPHLKTLYEEFGEGLVIISISVSPSSDTVEKLQQFRQTHNINWIVARDTVGVNDEYNVPYLPTLVIIDQEGYIQHQHSGPIDESVLQEEIYELMRDHISVLAPKNKIYSFEDVPLTFTVSESTSWIGYSLDGQMNVTISGNTTLVGLSDGLHTVIVYANDTVGNMGYSGTVYFTVDTVAPTIEILSPEILSPENKAYTTSSVPLSFAVDEGTSWIGYSLDGQENVTITGNITISGLSDGLHSLIVYAKYIAGDTGASDIVYFRIETQALPFSTLIVSTIVMIAVVGAALLVYFTKVKK